MREVLNTDLNRICRTCLSENDKFLRFLNLNEICINTELKYCDMLLDIAHTQIKSGDSLSEEICQQCAEKMIISYNFKLLCQQSEITLQKSNKLLEKLNDISVEQPSEILELSVDDVESKYSTEIILDVIDQNLPIKYDTKDFDFEAVEEDVKTAEEVSDIENNVSESEVVGQNNIVIEKSYSKKFTCSRCQQSFENNSDLRRHRRSHFPDVNHKCHLCERTYKRESSLQIHLITHSDIKAHLCPICGKRFHLAGGLQQHLKYHTGIKNHICEICNKRFYYQQRLNEHMRLAHSDNRYIHVCHLCNKTYTARSSLLVHLKLHTGERPHGCETCGKRFTRLGYLQAHIRTHTREPPPRMFMCTYENCDSVYPSNASLNVHIRHKHTKERPYSCEICHKAFFSRGGVTEHAKSHIGPKTEPCPFCEKRFVYKTSLRKHLRLHTGEKPYQCEHCSEKFTTSSRRNEHIKIKHMERQEECHLCHKRFHLRRTLKTHLRIRTCQKRPPTYTLPQLDNSIVPISIDSKQKVPEPGFEVVV